MLQAIVIYTSVGSSFLFLSLWEMRLNLSFNKNVSRASQRRAVWGMSEYKNEVGKHFRSFRREQMSLEIRSMIAEWATWVMLNMSLTMLPKLLAYFNTILTLLRNLELLQRTFSERNSVRHKSHKRTVGLQMEKKIMKVDKPRRDQLKREGNWKVLREPTLKDRQTKVQKSVSRVSLEYEGEHSTDTGKRRGPSVWVRWSRFDPKCYHKQLHSSQYSFQFFHSTLILSWAYNIPE